MKTDTIYRKTVKYVKNIKLKIQNFDRFLKVY